MYKTEKGQVVRGAVRSVAVEVRDLARFDLHVSMESEAYAAPATRSSQDIDLSN
jgi:hypothetical protein